MVQITVARDAGITVEEVQAWPVFKRWAEGQTLAAGVVSVVIHRANQRNGQLHQLLVEAVAENTDWPHSFVLRRPTVKVLVRITDGGRTWIAFLVQDRVATGHRILCAVEGSQPEGEATEATAFREVIEELGLEDVPNLDITLEPLRPAAFAAPSSTNDATSYVLATITVGASEIEEFVARLQNKQTGLVEEEGEDIEVIVVPEKEARRYFNDSPHRDAKTCHILSLAGIC